MATKEIKQKFQKYHRDNPQVFQEFLKLTREARAAGKQHYSVWNVFNKMRWDSDMKVNNLDEFKISNNYFAFHARLIMEMYPEFAGFYRTKPLKEY